MENIRSVSTTMKVTQEMNKPSEQQPMITDSTKKMDVTYKPQAIYQKVNINRSEQNNKETELYMVDEGVYFKENAEEKWFTYPEELLEDVINIQDIEMNQVEQLELLQDYVEHLYLKETDRHYIVTISGPVDDFQEFALALHDQVNKEITTDMDQVMSMVHIEDLQYEVFIEKETFLQKKMNMNMNLTLSYEGETVNLQTEAQTTFSKFNEIDEINIPGHIVQTAVELSLDLSELEEMEEIELEDAKLHDEADGPSD